MMTLERLYPYLLTPRERTTLWGGDTLVTQYGKHAEPGARIGESWECWDENVVANGAFAGISLADLRARLGAQLMGPLDASAAFPVLTKFIAAREALSVQVHPDDAYAQRVEQQPNGKTECWHILGATPGAELVFGWTRDTDRAEYERRVADGTLGEILRRIPVTPGETYFLPAGTLHAIGAGIDLFEVQQTSDLTYRIFDWNRVDADGKPRALHVDKAADVLDYRATTHDDVRTLTFPDAGCERTLLVAHRCFAFERVRVRAGALIATDGRPISVTALGAPLRIAASDVTSDLVAYGTAVVPAAAGALTLDAPGELLVVRPSPDLAALRAAAERGGVEASVLQTFFEQFA